MAKVMWYHYDGMELVDCEDNWRSISAKVGGWIECIFPFPDYPTLAIYLNEEGKIREDCFPNLCLYDDKEIYDVISGEFIVCNTNGFDGSIVELTAEQADYVTKYFESDYANYGILAYAMDFIPEDEKVKLSYIDFYSNLLAYEEGFDEDEEID